MEGRLDEQVVDVRGPSGKIRSDDGGEPTQFLDDDELTAARLKRRDRGRDQAATQLVADQSAVPITRQDMGISN